MASIVGSIRVLLSRASKRNICLQFGARRCKGGHFFEGKEIIFGMGSSIDSSFMESTGGLNPMAAIFSLAKDKPVK
jgi:hypothetical protein